MHRRNGGFERQQTKEPLDVFRQQQLRHDVHEFRWLRACAEQHPNHRHHSVWVHVHLQCRRRPHRRNLPFRAPINLLIQRNGAIAGTAPTYCPRNLRSQGQRHSGSFHVKETRTEASRRQRTRHCSAPDFCSTQSKGYEEHQKINFVFGGWSAVDTPDITQLPTV